MKHKSEWETIIYIYIYIHSEWETIYIYIFTVLGDEAEVRVGDVDLRALVHCVAVHAQSD